MKATNLHNFERLRNEVVEFCRQLKVSRVGTEFLQSVLHFYLDTATPNNILRIFIVYNLVLSSLLEHINTYSKGTIVSLPILGAGRTRLGKDKETILGHILSTLRMSRTPIPVKLQIVLVKDDWGKISLRDYR